MIPGSSSRENQPSTTEPEAEPELDDLDWPELKQRDDVSVGNETSRSRLDGPVEWSKDLKSEEEVYLDNLRRSSENHNTTRRDDDLTLDVFGPLWQCPFRVQARQSAKGMVTIHYHH